jgi:hypothetical protein
MQKLVSDEAPYLACMKIVLLQSMHMPTLYCYLIHEDIFFSTFRNSYPKAKLKHRVLLVPKEAAEHIANGMQTLYFVLEYVCVSGYGIHVRMAEPQMHAKHLK